MGVAMGSFSSFQNTTDAAACNNQIYHAGARSVFTSQQEQRILTYEEQLSETKHHSSDKPKQTFFLGKPNKRSR